MDKANKKILEMGLSLVGVSVFSFSDWLLGVLCSITKIEKTENNEMLLMCVGICLIFLAVYMHHMSEKRQKVLAIVGLDTVNTTRKFKNSNIINIIENVKGMNKKNSTSIVNEYKKDIDKCLENYSNYNISYFGIAPLPFIALAGNAYRKEKIYAHFEYFQKNDRIKALNFIPAMILAKLKLETKEVENSNIAVVTMETTCNINKIDLNQFKNCNLYRFYIDTPKTNAIISEKQLEEYSEEIANKIYQISKGD